MRSFSRERQLSLPNLPIQSQQGTPYRLGGPWGSRRPPLLATVAGRFSTHPRRPPPSFHSILRQPCLYSRSPRLTSRILLVTHVYPRLPSGLLEFFRSRDTHHGRGSAICRSPLPAQKRSSCPSGSSSLLPGGGRHRWYGLHIRARQEKSISTGPLLLRVLGPLYRVGWRPSTMLLHTFRFTRFRPILCVRADSSYLPPRHPQLPAEACPIHLPVRPK